MFHFGDPRWPGIAKLNEECGELIQVIGKLMGSHGEDTGWDGTDLRERLILEMANVAAALGFVEGELNRDERSIFRRVAAGKLNQFRQWHRDQAAAAPNDVDG
jgi:NTP pyrophosphatase (non-canonical NTP hydrolase)